MKTIFTSFHLQSIHLHRTMKCALLAVNIYILGSEILFLNKNCV